MRLVDADEITYKRDIAVTERFPKFGGFNGKIVYSVTKEEIDAMPTVDAVPVKHGRWIYHPDWQADGECGYECSECGMGSDVDYPYCMLCGARMEREGR